MFDALEVSRPSLEDVYLEITGGEEAAGERCRPGCCGRSGFTNKAFWRNPASAFFTFAFPLMFLVIFTSLLSNGHITIGNRRSTSRPTT